MVSNLPKLIVVLGPTASGKTSLSLKLAQKYHGQIISADSRQIYKYMDIGTDKIQDTRNVPHYLINIITPKQNYSLARYQHQAIKIIKQIQQKKDIPFLVGGTGMYIDAVIENWHIPRVKPNLKLRAQLEKEIQLFGHDKLYQRLIKLDPAAKNFVDSKNPRRIIRALEVCLTTQQPFSQQRLKKKPLFDCLILGINLPREKLYQKINQRTQYMVKNGLIDEVKFLIKKYDLQLPALQGLIYKEIIAYLNGQIDLNRAVELIQQNTRHYARRQITWFKRNSNIHWIKNFSQADKLVKQFLLK
ncbi:MAG: tRNA (adenosine(37)-N6)-dimethylallyltransferase MiaA [Patescibacteria group bacterium]|nr:tRNA (adenosine(37)-N6)-dimethylallyltransferase MiaA [Patescibacteria group bacterium]